MGKNALRVDGNKQYIYNEDTYYVTFQSGTTITGTTITDTRLGIFYYINTTNAEDTEIGLFPQDGGFNTTDPNSNSWYFADNSLIAEPPHEVRSNSFNRNEVIVWSNPWSGNTNYITPSTGIHKAINSGDTSLEDRYFGVSMITVSGSPTGIITGGTWNFKMRSAYWKTDGGTNEIRWRVYKCNLYETDNIFYSNDDFLFSGTTGALTKAWTDYNVNVVYNHNVYF